MDFAYRHPSIKAEVKQSGGTGQAIYAHTSDFDDSKSARQRMDFVSEYLNEFVENRGPKASKIKVASYACGHGRELERLELDTLRAIDCFYAIDTDSDALDEIQKHQGILHLKAIQKSVFRFQPEVYQFDIVYSMGLLDYLTAEQSHMLLGKMYTALRPGGRLLVDNLDMEAGNVAYCEAMMDWWRISKSKDELQAITDGLPGYSEADSIQIEKRGCRNYLEIKKGKGYIWV
jgi:SAM-dependent methyltransferase